MYHEPLFEGLDWVLSEADKRSIKVILVLTDYWEYNGGVAQYLDWSGATRNANKNDFFTDRACKRMYEANARILIERVNVFTGRRYRDDPAIFAWELINEPRCRGCANRRSSASDGRELAQLRPPWTRTTCSPRARRGFTAGRARERGREPGGVGARHGAERGESRAARD